MSRVPTFAVVGRLGLPLIAAATGLAIWATGSAAEAPSHSASAVSTADQLAAAPHAAGGVAVGVAIPSVVFGATDGLPQRLSSGTHQAVLNVWLAAQSPRSVATVTSSSGEVRGCDAVVLRAATVNKLRCTVVGTQGSTKLTVATSVAGQRFHVVYAHLAG